MTLGRGREKRVPPFLQLAQFQLLPATMSYSEQLSKAELIQRAGEAPRHLDARFSAEDIAEFEKLAKCLAVRRGR